MPGQVVGILSGADGAHVSGLAVAWVDGVERRACGAKEPFTGSVELQADRAEWDRCALLPSPQVPSMGRTGNCWDNVVVESFFGTRKQGILPKRPRADLRTARKAVGRYIHHYDNPVRRHSTRNYLSPIEFEKTRPQAA